MRYNNYHKHTHYSNIATLDCVSKMQEYIDRAVELGHTTVFSTEHGYAGNLFKFKDLIDKKNKELDNDKKLKMVVGAEFYYTDDVLEKSRQNHHLIVIALNNNGCKQINKLISFANQEGFYYKPRIDKKTLFEICNPKDVIITTACVAGILNRDDYKEVVKEFKDFFGDNFYLEVQNHNQEIQKKINRKAIDLSKELNIKIIHANDSHYIEKSDSKYRDLFLKAKGICYPEEGNFILDYPRGTEILNRYIRQGVLSVDEAMESLTNTLIFDKCEEITYINDEIKLPSISENPKKEFDEIIAKEWEKEKVNIPEERIKEYEDAIKFECDIVHNTNMEDYFILDYHIVKKAVEEYDGFVTRTGRGCFTEDALVHTKDTIKSIKDVKVGDFVVTKDGNFNKVLKTMSYNIDEELVQIKHLYGTDKTYPSICTLDHKILVNRSGDTQWVRAKDIKTTDYVCVPKIKVKNKINPIIDLNNYNNGFYFDENYIYERTNKQYKYSPSDVARHIGVGKTLIEDYANMKISNFERKPKKFKEFLKYIPFKTQEEYASYVKKNQFKKINRYINIDYIFNVFIGLMYGDGSTNNTRIELAINNTTGKDSFNRSIFNIIAKRLGAYVYEHKSNTKKLSQLYINSKTFCNFVEKELFKSKKYKEKQFNSMWFNQSKQNLKGIVKGLAQSDGSNEYYRTSFDNTSKSLINAYKLLCLMTNEGVNSLSVRKARIDSRGYNTKESYKLRLNKNSNNAKKKCNRTFEDENYYYLPVKDVKKLPKQKTVVYDIEVENEHNYLLNNMIVHNSAVSFYINKLLGFTDLDRLTSPVKLYPTRFMSETRILETRSLPDIDMNVSNQEPFIRATEDLLGKENCAWMLSFKPLQNASAFRLYCKAIGLDIDEYNDIAKELDNYIDDTKWRDIIKESEHFIGVIESISPSPCSMIVYNKPIDEEIGIIRTKDGYCCLLDGYYCDKYKYLKNDILKVSVWEMIKDVCELANISVPTIKELEGLLDIDTYTIYDNGLTCTVNQADSEFATNLVKEYKPRSVDEVCAFVAGIRPGFASLLQNFIHRKPYTTHVEELDELLKESYHYMLYQESIMSYLIWLGIPEDETYGIIKKISKKKFEEKELHELQETLKLNWIKKVGSEEGFWDTWQVINDAVRYAFNASHSLAYAYDSLYCAYLKSHYPLEYYTVCLNLYADDMKRTPRLIDECKYFNITINSPQFGYSKAEYFLDRTKYAIYKGVGSVKYLNEHTGDVLYSLSQEQEYKTFTDVLIKAYDKKIGNRNLNILVKLDYFKQFGGIKKLLTILELFHKKHDKKTMSKTKDVELYLPFKEIAKKNAIKETAKTLTMNYPSFIRDVELVIENEDIEITDKIMFQLEYTGGFEKKPYPSNNPRLCLVTGVKRWRDKSTISLFCLKSGNTKVFKIHNEIFDYYPFEENDFIYLSRTHKEIKRTKNRNGKWINTKELEDYITDYVIAV